MTITRKEKGATMLEFTLVSGLLFFMIFALIEGGRYLATMGVLYAAADRAIAVAASDSRLNEPIGSAKYNQGVEAVQRKFKETLAGSWIATNPSSGASAYLNSDILLLKPVVPTMATCAGAPSNEDALLNCPVKLEFSASINPIIPCLGSLVSHDGVRGSCQGPIPIRIFSASFKEPHKALTLPGAIDCRGRSASSPDFNTDCACDVDKYWDSPTKSCVCYSGQTDASGECFCPAKYEFNTVDKRCTYCPPDASNCTTPGTVFNQVDCACICDPSKGLTADSYGGCNACINTAKTVQNGECACPDEANAKAQCETDPNKLYNNTGCSCECNASKGITLDSNGLCNACTNTAKIVLNGECICPNLPDAKAQCELDPTKIYNNTTCSCGCKAGLAPDASGSCTNCADPNRKFENNACTGCVMTNADCFGGGAGVLDTNTCQCSCNWSAENTCRNLGLTYNPATCGCNCGPGGTYYYSSYSAFGSCSCSAGMSWNLTTRACTCDRNNGLTSDGAGGCECTGGADATQYYGYCECNNEPPTGCPALNGMPQTWNPQTCTCGC